METDDVYKKYDKNKNILLGAEEIEHCLFDLLKITMFPVERQNLNNCLRNTFNRSQLKKREFNNLLILNGRKLSSYDLHAASKCMWVVVTSL